MKYAFRAKRVLRRLEKKLEKSVNDVRLQSKIVNSSSDKVLFEGDYGIIGWKGEKVRKLFYRPNEGWGWYDGVDMVFSKKKTNNTVGQPEDATLASNNTEELYFTVDVTDSDEFAMNNQGAYFLGTIVKEVLTDNQPIYKVELIMGGTTSSALLLSKIKNNK